MKKREVKILKHLVDNYIETAKPVSSKKLTEFFDLSSATIRIELGRLEERGYVEQPYVSSGRTPTDRGYRFFVENIQEYEPKKELEDTLIEKDGYELAKQLANLTSSTVFLRDNRNDRVLTVGLNKVMRQPEFKKRDVVVEFMHQVEELERRFAEEFSSLDIPRIMIGSDLNELGVSNETEEFSLLFEGDDNRFLAFMGPKRMNYKLNLAILNTINRFLK